MAFNKTEKTDSPMRKKRRNPQKKESLRFLWQGQRN